MLDATPSPSVREPSVTAVSPRVLWLAGIALVVAAAAAFHNSFSGVMVFDDRPTIINNETIRDIRDLRAIWSPPLDTTVSGRPLANVSLAINYALGGLNPFGYHVVNLIIHSLAGLLLFGLVRRTLLRPGLAERFGKAAPLLAWVVAMLWLVHPLQTESVTYIVQRVEALAGVFYLLTLYAAVRAMEIGKPNTLGGVLWQVVSVLACWLGVMSKEVIVSVPLLVLLYDGTLAAGTFREALRVRGGLYAGLALSWVLLAWMILGAENRSGTAGFGTASSWAYLLTQCHGIVHYLRLAFWPDAQVFDYGKALESHLPDVWPQALFLVLLAAATTWAFARRSAWALPGVFFFAVLAPSSSLVPVATQTLAEHRMYLPLAAVMATCLIAGYALIGKWMLMMGVAGGVALGWATVKRNEIYHSEVALWTATAAAKPDNPRAVCTLGQSLFEAGRKSEAIVKYEEALRLNPDYFEALNNLGIAMLDAGRMDDARGYFEAAVKQRSDFADVRGNLGMILYAQGRAEEALTQCQEAVRLLPNSAEMRSNLGIVLQGLGRTDESIRECREAIRLRPDYAEAHSNLGMALASKGDTDEAVRSYDKAIALKPSFAEAHMNRGLALWALGGREDEAMLSYSEALRLNPDYFEAHNNLAASLEARGKVEASLPHYAAAVELRPESAQVRYNFGNALVKLRRWQEALPQCDAAVRLRPEHAESRANLGTALFFSGEPDAAAEQLRAAVRIDPEYVKAHYFLGNVYAAQRRTEEARRHYQEALRLNPDYAPARQNLERLR